MTPTISNQRTSLAAGIQRTNRDAGRSAPVPPSGRSTFSTDRKRADGCAESPTPFSPDSRREAGRSTYPKPHHLLIASLCCWAVVVILIGVVLI